MRKSFLRWIFVINLERIISNNSKRALFYRKEPSFAIREGSARVYLLETIIGRLPDGLLPADTLRVQGP